MPLWIAILIGVIAFALIPLLGIIVTAILITISLFTRKEEDRAKDKERFNVPLWAAIFIGYAAFMANPILGAYTIALLIVFALINREKGDEKE